MSLGGMMRKMTRAALVALTVSAMLMLGCDALKPERATPQQDMTIYGSLIAVESQPEAADTTLLRLKVGMPRVLSGKRAEEGKPPKTIEEEGLIALVTLTPDTVIVQGGRPANDLHGLKAGMDVVVLPAPGTTSMKGTKEIRAEASMVADFASFRAWRLPRALPDDTVVEEKGDPNRINSPGVEHAPVPVRNGKVLYFSAHLRRPWKEDGSWIGARRPGLKEASAGQPPVERTFRSELRSGGWSAPEPVVFPGLDKAFTVRVSWMSEDEKLCLVSVHDADGSRWVGRSERSGVRSSWGEVQRMDETGKGSAQDAAFLAGSTKSFAFATDRNGNLDIFLYFPKNNPEPQALDPRIDTVGNEWAPRTGPKNELFFCRGDRQLMYVKGVARPMKVDAAYRIPISEANPTADGKWVFACLPHYTPLDLDQDIVVMPWLGKARLGQPIPVDEWRPDIPAKN